MGKISSYPKITELTSDHLLLVDGSSGTKTIKAGDLVTALKALDSSEESPTTNMLAIALTSIITSNANYRIPISMFRKVPILYSNSLMGYSYTLNLKVGVGVYSGGGHSPGEYNNLDVIDLNLVAFKSADGGVQSSFSDPKKISIGTHYNCFSISLGESDSEDHYELNIKRLIDQPITESYISSYFFIFKLEVDL